ncbi:MAG: hypothetical protein PHW02_03845 [bacterium]|nr:hypothetical protein [bacterium]
MRKFLVMILIAAVFLTASADPFFSLDKADHFMTAFAMTLSASLAVKAMMSDSIPESGRILAAAAIPVFLSFAKEVYDGVSKEGTVSYKDLIYDFAGIFLGILIAR